MSIWWSMLVVALMLLRAHPVLLQSTSLDKQETVEATTDEAIEPEETEATEASLESAPTPPTQPPTLPPLQSPTPPPVAATSASSSEWACPCDLLDGRCDVNCCCDTDCKSVARDLRKLFSSCWRPAASLFSRRYCSRADLYADRKKVGAPVSDAGLFCIVTDNVPKVQLYEAPKPLEASQLAEPAFRWNGDDAVPGKPTSEAPTSSAAAFYVDGAIVLVMKANGRIDSLQMPAALNSGLCLTRRPVHFLREESRSCRFHVSRQCHSDGWNAFWAGQRHDIAVLRTPRAAVASNTSDWSAGLLPITTRYCVNESHCSSVERELFRPDADSGRCLDVVQSLTYRIVFNGTRGIERVYVDLMLANTSDRADFSIHFRTRFRTTAEENGVAGPVFERSGNPGYLVGRPVLVGRFNGSQPSPGGPVPLRLLPDCSGKTDAVRFGVNRLDFCRFLLQVAANRTVACAEWRRRVLQRLWGDQSVERWRVAATGRGRTADGNDTDWLVLHVDAAGLVCLSRRVRARLLLVHAKFGPVQHPQQRIIGVRLSLDSPEPDRLCRPADAEEPTCQVLLAADVRFEDASQPAATRLPVPPSFSVRLPHDFFYPFRLISSPAVGLRSSFSTILLGLVCFHLTFRE